MLNELRAKWKKLLPKLNPRTGVCQICCHEIYDFTFFQLNEVRICEKCFNSFSVLWQGFEVNGISGLAIYQYNDFIKEKIYLFKGCRDYELGAAFLCRYQAILKIMYRNYVIVPIPSWIEDDKKRGFNHVEEIFRPLGLKFVKCLYKKYNYKQSERSKSGRENIKDVLDLIKTINITNKNILVVDDVYTTGATIKSAICLLRKQKPRKIKILILSMNCRKLIEKHERKKFIFRK